MYINPNFHEDSMGLPNQCMLCKAESNKQSSVTPHVFGDVDKKHAFYKCKDCDVIYLYPQLNLEQEKEFYAREFEKFMNDRSGTSAGWQGPIEHIKANQSQFQRRWHYLKNYLPSQGSILEVGCSSGFMLFPLKEQGYECYGIEPSGAFSEYVAKQGIPLFQSLEESNKKFDIIMNFFVMEHVREPREFIQACLSHLNLKGKLIIEIPNANDPLVSIYDVPAFERFYWSIAHHWYFSENSLKHMLEKIPNISYTILKDQRYDLSNHMTWARDGKPGGMGRFTAKLGGKLEEYYKEALVKSGYCDTLVLVIEGNVGQ